MDGLVRQVAIDAVHLLRRCLSSPIGAGAVGVMPQAGRARRDHPDRHPGHNPHGRSAIKQFNAVDPVAKWACSQAFWSATAKNGREFLGKIVRRCCSRQRRSKSTAEASSRPNSKPGASISGSCRRSRISRPPPERPKRRRELGRGMRAIPSQKKESFMNKPCRAIVVLTVPNPRPAPTAESMGSLWTIPLGGFCLVFGAWIDHASHTLHATNERPKKTKTQTAGKQAAQIL